MELNYWELDSFDIRAEISEKCVQYVLRKFLAAAKAYSYPKQALLDALKSYGWNFIAEGLEESQRQISSAELSAIVSAAIRQKYHVHGAASKFGKGVTNDAILSAMYFILYAKHVSGKEKTKALDAMLKQENGLSTLMSSIYRGKENRQSVSILNILSIATKVQRESIQREISGYVLSRGYLVPPKVNTSILTFLAYTALYGKAYLVAASQRMQYHFKEDSDIAVFKDLCAKLELPFRQHRKREFMIHRIGIFHVMSAYLGVDFFKIQENREKAMKAIDGLQNKYNVLLKTPIEERKDKEQKPEGGAYIEQTKDIKMLVYFNPDERELEVIYNRLMSASRSNPGAMKSFIYKLTIMLVSVGKASITSRAVILRSRNAAMVLAKLNLIDLTIKGDVISMPKPFWDSLSSGPASR